MQQPTQERTAAMGAILQNGLFFKATVISMIAVSFFFFFTLILSSVLTLKFYF